MEEFICAFLKKFGNFLTWSNFVRFSKFFFLLRANKNCYLIEIMAHTEAPCKPSSATRFLTFYMVIKLDFIFKEARLIKT